MCLDKIEDEFPCFTRMPRTSNIAIRIDWPVLLKQAIYMLKLQRKWSQLLQNLYIKHSMICGLYAIHVYVLLCMC